jgi:hypothetical protein
MVQIEPAVERMMTTAFPRIVSLIAFLREVRGKLEKVRAESSANFRDYKRPAPSIPKSVGDHKEWLDACKGDKKTLCNFDYSGSLIEHNLLGNVAHRAARRSSGTPKHSKSPMTKRRTNC